MYAMQWLAGQSMHGKVLLCNHSKRREESRKSSLSQTIEVKDRINTETESLHKLCMSLILNDKYCRYLEPSHTYIHTYIGMQQKYSRNNGYNWLPECETLTKLLAWPAKQ